MMNSGRRSVLVFFLAALLLISIVHVQAVKAETKKDGDWEYEEYTYSSGDDSWEAARITKYTGTATSVTVPARIGGLSVYSLSGWVFPCDVKYDESTGENVYVGKMKSITVSPGIKIIYNAFDGQTSLKKIVLPDGLQTIHIDNDCGVSQLELPDSVGDYELNNLPKLTYLKTPKSKIKEEYIYGDISNCQNLTKISIPQGTNWTPHISDCDRIQTIVMPNTVKYVGNIQNCKNLNSIQYPKETVKWIGEIINCENLNSIRFPKELENDNEISLFVTECPSLSSLTVPKNVTSVTFTSDTSLAEITLPDSLETIRSVQHCKALKKIHFNGNKAQWEKVKKYDWESKIKKASLSLLPSLKVNAKIKGSDLETISSKSYISYCRKCIFRVTKKDKEVVLHGGSSSAEHIFIPSTITYKAITYKVVGIADNAFKNHKKLSSVEIESDSPLKSIGKNAFSGCKKLLSVEFNQSLSSINSKAFYNCKKLWQIKIPSKVKKIGKSAFQNCKQLSHIDIKTSKLTNKSVGAKAFKGISKSVWLSAPKKKLKAYKKWLKKKGLPKTTYYSKL